MLIKNTTARLIGTHVGPSGSRKRVSLRPGNNDVRPEDWKIVREYAAIKALLDEGEIIEPAEKTPAAAPQVTSLAAFNQREAVRLVKETVDPTLLEVWATGEKRREVAKAIEAQLKKIDPRTAKAGEGELGAEGDKGDEGDGEGDDEGEPDADQGEG